MLSTTSARATVLDGLEYSATHSPPHLPTPVYRTRTLLLSAPAHDLSPMHPPHIRNMQPAPVLVSALSLNHRYHRRTAYQRTARFNAGAYNNRDTAARIEGSGPLRGPSTRTPCQTSIRRTRPALLVSAHVSSPLWLCSAGLT